MSATQITSAALAAARHSDVHEQYVLTNTNLFFEMVHDEFFNDPKQGIEQLETYANHAKQLLNDASREMQDFIKEKFENDTDLLTKHADRMRTAGANVLLLRDGLVPALKVDKDNPKFRALALQTFGYIRAEVEATKNIII